MKLPAGDPIDRRRVAIGLGAAAGLAGLGGPAAGQIAGIEVVASGPPGGGQDQLARAIAEGLALTKLTPRAMAVNAPRDVDALNDFLGGKRPRAALMVVGLSTLGSLYEAKASDRLTESRPVARVLGEQLPIVVSAESRLKTIADLASAIRDDAGRVVWAGRAKGGADHMLCLSLTKAVGGDVSRIAYQSFATSADTSYQALRGDVVVATGALFEFARQLKGGTLRALAIASPERSHDFDVPTLKEAGIDVDEVNWRGLISRSAVGSALIDRYAEAVSRVVKTPGWRSLMRDRFWVDMYQPPDAFAAFLAAERDRVAALLAGVGPI